VFTTIGCKFSHYIIRCCSRAREHTYARMHAHHVARFHKILVLLRERSINKHKKNICSCFYPINFCKWLRHDNSSSDHALIFELGVFWSSSYISVKKLLKFCSKLHKWNKPEILLQIVTIIYIYIYNVVKTVHIEGICIHVQVRPNTINIRFL